MLQNLLVLLAKKFRGGKTKIFFVADIACAPV